VTQQDISWRMATPSNRIRFLVHLDGRLQMTAEFRESVPTAVLTPIPLGSFISYKMTTFHNSFCLHKNNRIGKKLGYLCWYHSFSGRTKTISILFEDKKMSPNRSNIRLNRDDADQVLSGF
jgi:hypothetical protein